MKTRVIQRLFLALLIIGALVLAAVPVKAQIGQPYAQVTGVRAPVFAGPGLGFWQFGALRRNVITPISGVTADRQWWLSETPIGKGYLRAADVTVVGGESVPVVDPGVIGTITTGAANVRSGPGPEARSLNVIQKGSQFFVIGRQPDGSWIEIRYRYGTGWVKASLTSLGGGTSVSVPSTEGAVAIADSNSAKLYSGPGTQYVVIGTLTQGAVLPIIGRSTSGRWLYVSSDLGEGWLSANSAITRNYFGNAPIISAEETGAQEDFTAITRTGANVRTGPSLGFQSIGAVPGATEIFILGQSADKGWWYAETPVGTGWIAKSVVKTPRDFSKVAVIP